MTRAEQREQTKQANITKTATRVIAYKYSFEGAIVFQNGISLRRTVTFNQLERDDKKAIITANRCMNCVNTMAVQKVEYDGFGRVLSSSNVETVDCG